MQEIMFRKNVSKGSRFNQIYIPIGMESQFEAGDEVEVRLLKKNIELYYSPGLKRLSEFKESLIKGVFSFLGGLKGISGIFIVGSFLTKKADYRDIDILLITEERIKEAEVYNKLTDKFNLKFHILPIDAERLEDLLATCPLTRAMLNAYISNKKVNLERKKIIDRKHLEFLLMMPEDLLDIRLGSRVFFDNLRRLITIQHFLDDKSLKISEINSELKGLLGERLFSRMENNDEADESVIERLRKVIALKINEIRKRV